MTAILIRLAVGKRRSALTAIVSPVSRLRAKRPISPRGEKAAIFPASSCSIGVGGGAGAARTAAISAAANGMRGCYPGAPDPKRDKLPAPFERKHEESAHGRSAGR